MIKVIIRQRIHTMKIKKMLLGLVYLILTCLCDQEQVARLELISQQRGASCLDGTPPGIYIHQGKGENQNKFMIYFDGGGFCQGSTTLQTLDSCYKRSSTQLGSTKKYSKFMNFSEGGILSPLEKQNPVFYDWNKIFVIYCDGSEYMGHRDEPINYKKKKLYFRGSKNVMQTFNYLNEKYQMYSKDTIVITGVSSGGLATFQWSNYLNQQTKTAKVLAMPDSGFFITDYFSPIVQTKVIRMYASSLMQLIYYQKLMPEPIKLCLSNKQEFDMIDCTNSGNYIQYVKPPMLIIQSTYDEFALSEMVVADCLENDDPPFSIENCNQATKSAIEQYRKETLQYFQIFLNSREDIGIWSPACVQHGFEDQSSFTDSKYQVKKMTLFQAVQNFINNPSSPPRVIDTEPWPSNKGCSGLSSLKKYKNKINIFKSKQK